MATKLELAKAKLERLEKERTHYSDMARKEIKQIPFGQPNIIGRRNIYKDAQRYSDKSFKLSEEIDKQIERIEMLEKVGDFKNDNELLKDVHVVGKTAYATVGARTSINNLEYFKDKLEKLIKTNEEAKAYNKTNPSIKSVTYGAEITKLRNKIKYLESIKNKSDNDSNTMSEKTRQLIDEGLVNQWKKKPIYYFVKGVKKVALVINENGEFEISKQYAPQSQKERDYVDELLSSN